MKSKIREVLSFPHHYLIASGGEGMEFLSTVISTCSNAYRASDTNSHVSQDNRFIVNPPYFFDLFAALVNTEASWSIDHLVDLIEHRMQNFNSVVSPEEIINQALAFNAASPLPSLHRQHFLNTDYFNKSNAYLLYIDKFEWFLYRQWLHFHKVWKAPLFSEPELDNVIKFYYVSAPDARIKSLLEQFKMQSLIVNTPVYEGHLQGITYLSETITKLPEDYIYRTPLELFNCIYTDFKTRYDNYVHRLNNHHIFERYNMIGYSNLIENIHKMFAINNSTILEEKVLQWHNKNLSLIANDMDVSNLQVI